MHGSAAAKSTAIWLAAIVAIGAALRFYPIWFGLPYLNARPDESTAVTHALAVMEGDFNPHFFHWPSLTFYVFAAAFTVVSDVLGALLPGAVVSDAGRLVVARFCVALAGTATVAVLYVLARRVSDAWAGLAAAAFLAVAVLHVRESHFAMTDVLMTLLATASLAMVAHAVDVEESGAGSLKSFAAAGLLGGLAASTKYSAAAVIAAMAAVQLTWFLKSPRRIADARAWVPSAAFMAAFAGGFLLATPYALLDARAFTADLRFDFTHLSTGHVVNFGRGWSYHLTRSLPYGAGLLVFLAALAGIVPMARHHGIRAIAVGAFALAFYASIGSGLAVFFRYVLPLVPVVCLFAGVAARHAGAWLSSRTPLSSGAATMVVVAVIVTPSFTSSLSFDVLLARTDTRVLAADWLRPRVAPDETLHEGGGNYAALDLSGMPIHQWSFNPLNGSFGDPDGRIPDWLVLEESPLWTYANVAPELRRIAAERYTLVHDVPATSGASGVYDLQDAFFMPVSGFGDVQRAGPNVQIYRRRDLPAPPPR